MSIKSLNYITPKGLEALKNELHELLHKERPAMVKTVAWAAEQGDRSENADYIYGKKRLREIDRRIHFLQGRLDNVEVVDPLTVKSDCVSFGATVTVEDEEGVSATYQIVGEDELEPTKGKISWKSPMAKSLMGKKEGDETVVRRPKGDVEVVVVRVEYI